jgi:hypothetical protein
VSLPEVEQQFEWAAVPPDIAALGVCLRIRHGIQVDDVRQELLGGYVDEITDGVFVVVSRFGDRPGR